MLDELLFSAAVLFVVGRADKANEIAHAVVIAYQGAHGVLQAKWAQKLGIDRLARHFACIDVLVVTHHFTQRHIHQDLHADIRPNPVVQVITHLLDQAAYLLLVVHTVQHSCAATAQGKKIEKYSPQLVAYGIDARIPVFCIQHTVIKQSSDLLSLAF